MANNEIIPDPDEIPRQRVITPYKKKRNEKRKQSRIAAGYIFNRNREYNQATDGRGSYEAVMDYKSKNVQPPSEMNLCSCEGPCTCPPCLPYLQVSEDGNYPDSHCPPNPGCLPNGQYEVTDGSVISDTPTHEEWYRVYHRNWALHTEEPRRNLENAPKIVHRAHLKYSEKHGKPYKGAPPIDHDIDYLKTIMTERCSICATMFVDTETLENHMISVHSDRNAEVFPKK